MQYGKEDRKELSTTQVLSKLKWQMGLIEHKINLILSNIKVCGDTTKTLFDVWIDNGMKRKGAEKKDETPTA